MAAASSAEGSPKTTKRARRDAGETPSTGSEPGRTRSRRATPKPAPEDALARERARQRAAHEDW